jgi:hypothetical protein
MPTISTWRRLGAAAAGLALIVGLLHALCLHYFPKGQMDPWGLSDFWPLSVFTLRVPAWWAWGWALAAAGLYAAARPALERRDRLAPHLAFALALVVLSNLTQGFQWGLDYPTAGWGDGGIEYWQDACAIRGPLWFLRHFTDVQPFLLSHAKTHPPGPVLLYYGLGALLGWQPWLVSLAVAALALGLTLWGWSRLLRRLFGKVEGAWLLLLVVLPGVQIYYLAVMDAVFAGVLLAALADLSEDEGWASLGRGAAWLGVASLLSFSALFLGPVLVGRVLWRRRGWGRLALAVALLLLGLAALKLATGYDEWDAFRTASRLENPGGFLGFSDPRRYLWFRLGAALEIALYLTPFLLLQLPLGLRRLRERAPEARALFWLALGTVAAMLLSGAMKVGEAARICLYLFPYLLLPAVAALDGQGPSAWRRVPALVLGQSLLMQLFGFYQW